MTSSRRLKLVTILAVLLSGGLGLLASTQTWYVYHLSATTSGTSGINASGMMAAPALTALSLAALALGGALSIAGPVIRWVLGALSVVIGACVIFSAVSAMSDPIAAGSRAITDVTGITGNKPVHELVLRTDPSMWPIVGFAAGILAVLCGIALLATHRRWPRGTQRYQAVRFDHVHEEESAPRPEESSRDTAIDSWDDLSHGQDPTA